MLPFRAFLEATGVVRVASCTQDTGKAYLSDRKAPSRKTCRVPTCESDARKLLAGWPSRAKLLRAQRILFAWGSWQIARTAWVPLRAACCPPRAFACVLTVCNMPSCVPKLRRLPFGLRRDRWFFPAPRVSVLFALELQKATGMSCAVCARVVCARCAAQVVNCLPHRASSKT